MVTQNGRNSNGNGAQKTFNLRVDDVPYIVKAEPFSFNGETRFYISLNGGTDHVFTWDSEVGRLRAIDDQAAIIPDAVEEAISQKLLTLQK
jgi:hypothetical protein